VTLNDAAYSALIFGLGNAGQFWVNAGSFYFADWLQQNSNAKAVDVNNALFIMFLGMLMCTQQLGKFGLMWDGLAAVHKIKQLTENRDWHKPNDSELPALEEFGDIEFKDVFFK